MEIDDNKLVKINYVGKLQDNSEVFDKSNDKPLEFIFGIGMLVPGLEKEIKGMKKGDKKVVNVNHKDAYGEYHPEAIEEVPKSHFEGIELKPGLNLIAKTPYGELPVVIKEIKGNSVVLDFNHPLAGKDLIFEVEVVDITDATDEDFTRLGVQKKSKES